MKMNNAMIGFSVSLFILGPMILFIFVPDTRFNYRRPEKPVEKVEAKKGLSKISGLKNLRVTAIAHGEDGAMYLGTAYGLSKSTDGGKTFQSLNFDGTVGDDNVTAVVVGKQSLFVAVRYSYDQFAKAVKTPVFISKDGGDSFEPVMIPKDYLHREVDAMSLGVDEELFLSIGTHFIVSADDGDSFQLATKTSN